MSNENEQLKVNLAYGDLMIQYGHDYKAWAKKKSISTADENPTPPTPPPPPPHQN